MAKLKDIYNEVFEKTWTFKPSGAVKIIHFVNDFVKYLCNKDPDIEMLHKTMAYYRLGTNSNTNEQIKEDLKDVFKIESTDTLKNIKIFFSSLDLVLDQDNGIFPSPVNSSLTLTHHNHVSKDFSGQGTGKFIANVLIAMENDEVVRTIRNSFDDESDNIYMLTYPLLNDNSMGPIPEIDEDFKNRINNIKIMKNVQESFKNLISYKDEFEKTVFLQRIIILGFFSVFLYLINKNKENNEEFIPILFVGENKDPKVREASHSIFSRAKKEMRFIFEKGLKKELKARGQYNLSSKKEYEDLMKEWLKEYKESKPQKFEDLWDIFQRNYESVGNSSESFVNAITETSLSRINGTPQNFIRYIGYGMGLVYPKKGSVGRLGRYYLPSPKFIDMLIVVLLNKNEEITLKDFFKRAYNQFGIMCGAFPNKEAKLLRNDWQILQITPDDLEENFKDIKNKLKMMGYVREYSDGVAIISSRGY